MKLPSHFPANQLHEVLVNFDPMIERQDIIFAVLQLEISGNTALRQIIQTFRPLMQILSIKSEPKDVFREHAAILDAIEQGDQEAAEHKIREHILNSKKHIERSLSYKKLLLKDILQ